MSNLIFINKNRSFLDGFLDDIVQKLLVIILTSVGLIKVYQSSHFLRDFFFKLLNFDNVKNVLVDADFMQEIRARSKLNRKCPKHLKISGKKKFAPLNEYFKKDEETSDDSENKPGCCGKCCGSKDRSRT